MLDEATPSFPPGSPVHPTLDYAQRTHLGWVGRHRRLLLFLAICVAVSTPICRYWQPLKQRVLWHYWFHQAASHRMPASIQFTVTGAGALSLLKENREYAPPSRLIGTTQPTAFYLPESYRRLGELDPRLEITSWGPLGMEFPSEFVFMGSMRRPDGRPRLVIITYVSFMGPNNGMAVLVLPYPGLFDAPPRGSFPSAGVGFGGQGRDTWTADEPRLAAASIDASDPSHLIIPYTMWEVTKTIASRSIPILPPPRNPRTGLLDMYIDNNDTLSFQPREPQLWQNVLRGEKSWSIQGNPDSAQSGAGGLPPNIMTTPATQSRGTSASAR